MCQMKLTELGENGFKEVSLKLNPMLKLLFFCSQTFISWTKPVVVKVSANHLIVYFMLNTILD